MQAIDSEVMHIKDVGNLLTQLTIHYERQIQSTESLVRQMAQHTETIAQNVETLTQKMSSLDIMCKRIENTLTAEKTQLTEANATLVKQKDALIEYANEFEEKWSDRMEEGFLKGIGRETMKMIDSVKKEKKYIDPISQVIENHKEKLKFRNGQSGPRSERNETNNVNVDGLSSSDNVVCPYERTSHCTMTMTV